MIYPVAIHLFLVSLQPTPAPNFSCLRHWSHWIKIGIRIQGYNLVGLILSKFNFEIQRACIVLLEEKTHIQILQNKCYETERAYKRQLKKISIPEEQPIPSPTIFAIDFFWKFYSVEQIIYANSANADSLSYSLSIFSHLVLTVTLVCLWAKCLYHFPLPIDPTIFLFLIDPTILNALRTLLLCLAMQLCGCFIRATFTIIPLS